MATNEQATTTKDVSSYVQSTIGADEDQYLTFILAEEEYGVDILRVQEVKGWDTVTSIPNTPEYIRGVINLRGDIVPIFDLRLRFGIEAIEYGAATVIIVLKVNNGKEELIIGLVVDAVSDVYNLPSDQMKPPPKFGSSVDVKFVKGIATVDEKMVIVMDVDELYSREQLSQVNQVKQNQSAIKENTKEEINGN